MKSRIHDDGPSIADLAAIEAEWPMIQADVVALADPEVVEALLVRIDAIERGSDELTRRRQRRAEARATRTVVEQAGRPVALKAVA